MEPWSVIPFTFATFVNVTKELLKTGWILSVYMLLEYFLTTTSVLFCGRIGSTEMASAGIAQSIISILCFMPGYGMVTVCNTYFSVAFGSKDDRKQCIILQKALLLSWIVSMLCWAILINTESILRLLQQKEEISILAGEFVRVYLPAVPAMFASFVLSRYLQCRNHVMVTMLALLFTAIVNIILNYVFVISMNGGTSWSAGSLVISQYVYLIIIIAYTSKYVEWTGWSAEALDDWYEFSVIGVNGCLMLELATLVFEAGFFFCGMFGAIAVDVFGAVYVMLLYLLMVCSGLSSALAIRIGQRLGENEPGHAKEYMQVAYTLCWISALLVGVLLFIFSDYVGYVFTTNRVVVEEIAKIVPVLVIFEISDFTTNIGRGVVQGCGRQKFGALISFVSFYFIGLPVCIYLVLFRKWQAEGMWIGLCIAQSLQAIGLLFYTFSIDWDHEVHLSKERIGDQSEHTEAAKGNEEGISKVERMPLVNTNGFKLSRNVIYLRIMNTALATIICASGVIFYFLY